MASPCHALDTRKEAHPIIEARSIDYDKTGFIAKPNMIVDSDRRIVVKLGRQNRVIALLFCLDIFENFVN